MKKEHLTKGLLLIIFVLYMAVLIKIILLKHLSIIDLWQGNAGGYRSYNIIPFQIFTDYTHMWQSSNWLRAVSNTFGNIMIFVPLGMLLPVLFRKMQTQFKLPIMVICCTSILFESLQYIMKLGSADIDDVMLNTVGGLIGVILFRAIRRVTKGKSYISHAAIATIIILAAFPAYWVAKEEFGQMLGLTTFKTTYIGDEHIPTTPQDVHGTILKITDKQVDYYSSLLTNNKKTNAFLDKKETLITKETKIYSRTEESSETESVISYKELAHSDVFTIEKHATISIWINKETSKADVIVLSQPLIVDEDILNESKVSSKNSKEELSGTILDIKDNSLILNVAMTEEQADGGSVALQGLGDLATKANVVLTPDAKFKKRVSNKSGTKYKDEKFIRSQLAEGQSLQLQGYYKQDTFYAVDIIIYEFK